MFIYYFIISLGPFSIKKTVVFIRFFITFNFNNHFHSVSHVGVIKDCK